MRLSFVVALLALSPLLPACAASNAQIEQAKASSYQTDRATVFREMKASVEADYQLSYWNEGEGVVESQWQRVKGDLDEQSARSAQGDRVMRPGFHFRVRLAISKLGPPWSVLVDGIAGEFRPGFALIYEFKHGVDDEPSWVQGRIDNMNVELYEHLKQFAVVAPKPGASAARTSATTPTQDGLMAQEILKGPSQDWPRGIALLTKACDGGHAASCGQLAYATTAGTSGVAIDEAKGTALYQRACTGGDLDSCGYLGASYADGRGVAQDHAKARTLYTSACDGGIGHACYGLGLLLQQGLGGDKDDARAAALIQKACEAGVPAACKID